MDTVTIATSLIGFIQVILVLVLSRLFNSIDTLHKRIEKLKDDYRGDIKEVSDSHTTLLDKHYVTKGQLSTLEQSLMGEIKLLRQSIESFTKQLSSALSRVTE